MVPTFSTLGEKTPRQLKREKKREKKFKKYENGPVVSNKTPGSDLVLDNFVPTRKQFKNGYVLEGNVVSTKMQKTVVVKVKRDRFHPKYKIKVSKHKKIFAHDENEECNMDDQVRIRLCRPISKHKSYVVQEVLRKANQFPQD